MDLGKQFPRNKKSIIAVVAVVVVLGTAVLRWSDSNPIASNVRPRNAEAAANVASGLPRNVPQRAAKALELARKWRSDAVLVGVGTERNLGYALNFSFRSLSGRARLEVTDANGRVSSRDSPANGYSAMDDAIPLQFIDLPEAITQAQQQGMPASIKQAYLEVSHSDGGVLALAWMIQPETDRYPYLYTIAAMPGGATINKGVIATSRVTAKPDHSAAGAPSPPIDSNRASMPSPAAEAFWQKGTALYDRGDYKNALSTYGEAAKLGHPRAMAVLGNMYREGQGTSQDLHQAVGWYTRAAENGNRAAQFSLGSMYEEGEGVPKDVAKAAQLYGASARQGMPEAQFALGLSYEFGQGVPRNRQSAIYWLRQVAAQGDGRAKWYADWLSRPDTPQFKDEAELGRYTANQVAQKNPSNRGNSPGIDPYFNQNSDYWRNRRWEERPH